MKKYSLFFSLTIFALCHCYNIDTTNRALPEQDSPTLTLVEVQTEQNPPVTQPTNPNLSVDQPETPTEPGQQPDPTENDPTIPTLPTDHPIATPPTLPYNLVANGQGIPRDLVFLWSQAVTQPNTWQLEVVGHYQIALTSQTDQTTLQPTEAMPPWTTMQLFNNSGLSVLFTTGSDLLADAPRIVEQTPKPGKRLYHTQALELRFAKRLNPNKTPLVEASCDSQPLAVRWLWQQAGSRARIEPLHAWSGTTCLITIDQVEAYDNNHTAGPWQISFDLVPLGHRVRIQEVVVDPQQDWSDENGIAFDMTVGNGTVSITDEFIELINATGQMVNLTDWRLEFLDGSDEVLWLNDLQDVVVYTKPETSDLTALPPCGLVLIGNPPGSINNESVVRLINADGELEDRVHLTSELSLAGTPGVFAHASAGGANSPLDEAVYPQWVTGDGAPLVRGPASPGVGDCN